MELVFYEPMPLWAVACGAAGFALLVALLVMGVWHVWRATHSDHVVNYRSPTIRQNLKRVK